jgi:hypothetical protein
MSIPALAFAIYFFVGLTLMIVAVATHDKERRARYLDVNDGTEIGAGLMIFIVLLWPLWLILAFSKEGGPKQ